eukprot:5565745-Pyramimonas_sp.AAC.1
MPQRFAGRLPSTDSETYHRKYLGVVKKCLGGRHWGCQALVVLKKSEMVDRHAGMQKIRHP